MPAIAKRMAQAMVATAEAKRTRANIAPTIEVACECERWTDAALTPLVEQAVTATLADVLPAFAGLIEVSVLLTDDANIRELNRDHRGKDKPTNVLSFPLLASGAFDEPGALAADDSPVLLGDIVLSWDTIAREAAEQEKTTADHVVHLSVHGVLHLLGYDHENEEEAKEMEALEVRILRALGVDDPYVVASPDAPSQ